jgi:hypothetical protein
MCAYIGSRSLSSYKSFDIVVHACVCVCVCVCEDDTGGGVDGVEGAKILSLRLQRE